MADKLLMKLQPNLWLDNVIYRLTIIKNAETGRYYADKIIFVH